MENEKCFCHFNGYEVKDANARARLDVLEAGGGTGGSSGSSEEKFVYTTRQYQRSNGQSSITLTDSEKAEICNLIYKASQSNEVEFLTHFYINIDNDYYKFDVVFNPEKIRNGDNILIHSVTHTTIEKIARLYLYWTGSISDGTYVPTSTQTVIYWDEMSNKTYVDGRGNPGVIEVNKDLTKDEFSKIITNAYATKTMPLLHISTTNINSDNYIYKKLFECRVSSSNTVEKLTEYTFNEIILDNSTTIPYKTTIVVSGTWSAAKFTASSVSASSTSVNNPGYLDKVKTVSVETAYSNGAVVFDVSYPTGYTKDNCVIIGHNTYLYNGSDYNSKEVNVTAYQLNNTVSGYVTFPEDCTGYTAYTTITLMRI